MIFPRDEKKGANGVVWGTGGARHCLMNFHRSWIVG